MAMEDWLRANDSTTGWQDMQFYEIADPTGDQVLELCEVESLQNAPVNSGGMGLLKRSSRGLASQDARRILSLWPQPLLITAIGQNHLSAFDEVEKASLWRSLEQVLLTDPRIWANGVEFGLETSGCGVFFWHLRGRPETLTSAES